MKTIVLTIHNKEWLLQRQLESLRATVIEPVEIVLMFDGCTDKSLQLFLQWKKENGYWCDRHSIKVFEAPNVFETKANNIGFRNSTGDLIYVIQDDMLLSELNWMDRMAKPFQVWSDVFAVTARTAHNWVYNPKSVHQYMTANLDNCWCDVLNHTEHASKVNTPRNVFSVRDSANRGPLVLDHDSLRKLNYLDETFSPQDMDDHDLCYRAYKELGKVSGCFWIGCVSHDAWGGTRVNGSPASWLLQANHKNVKTVWQRHKDLILGPKHNEERTMP